MATATVALEYITPRQAERTVNSIIYNYAIDAIKKQGDTDTNQRVEELFFLRQITEGLEKQQ